MFVKGTIISIRSVNFYSVRVVQTELDSSFQSCDDQEEDGEFFKR